MGCWPSSTQVSVHAARPVASVASVASVPRYHLPRMLSVTAAPPTGERCTTPSSSTDWLMTSTASWTGDPVNGGLGAMLEVTT